MNEVVVDLRRPEEFEDGHLPEAVNIPHDEFIARAQAGKLDKNVKYLLHCRSGARVGLVVNAVQGYDLVNVQQRFNAQFPLESL